MNRTVAVTVSLILALVIGLTGCSKSGPVPTAPVYPSSPRATPVPMPTPVFSNSESSSTIAELEAKIKQLEAENQRLLAENQQLNSELVKVNAVLQNLQTLVNSSSYTLALDRLTEIQSKTGELAYFAEGLPDLPPLPPGLTPSKIEQVVGMVQVAYDVIYHLPPLPPFPPELAELERQRQTILEIFKFVGDLRDLPQFLAKAESLEELRSRIENYLADIHNTTSYTGDIMQQVRDAIR